MTLVILAGASSKINSGSSYSIPAPIPAGFSTPDEGDANLIALWKFDDGSGTTAIDSIGANNGTIGGSATWNGSSSFGYAGDDSITFDGIDDRVDVSGGFGTLVSNSSFTFQCWFSRAELGVRHYLFSDVGNILPASLTIELSSSDQVNISLRTDTAFNYQSNNAFSWVIDQTYMICVTYQVGGKASVYMNGVLLGQTTDILSGTMNNGANMAIGAFGELTFSEFKGTIDHVMVYNDVRTPTEILTDYENGPLT